MDVVIAGGSGQIALMLSRLLVGRGDRVRGLIRSEKHTEALRAVGAEPVLCDLEDMTAPVASVLDGADSLVFAAGSGPASGPERKRTMDLFGALRLHWAAGRSGLGHYVMISAIRADNPPADDGDFGAYLRAKGEADIAIQHGSVPFTIVRPGWLTDDAPTGRVQVGASLPAEGKICRMDVASVLLEVIHAPHTRGKTFDLLAGTTPITQALASLG